MQLLYLKKLVSMKLGELANAGTRFRSVGSEFFVTVNVILILCTLLTPAVYAEKEESGPCPNRQYFDVETNKCVKCTQCDGSNNEIIRLPCGKYYDTLCGPFYEWKEVNFHIGSTEDRGHNQEIQTLTESTKPLCKSEESYKWKIVALALIGVLVLIVLSISMIGIYFCITKRNRKQDSGDLCHRARLFSRDRLNTTEYQHSLALMENGPTIKRMKKKTLLRVYKPQNLQGPEMSDEVFECEEKKPPKGRFRLGPLPHHFMRLGVVSESEEPDTTDDEDQRNEVDYQDQL